MAGKRRAVTGKADKFEQGLSKAFGSCRCTTYGAAACFGAGMMWAALLILWIVGSYIAKDAQLPSATSCVAKTNISIGVGGNSYIWWASSSGFIIILTLCATCACCCSIAGLCWNSMPKVASYVGVVCVILSLLCYSVFLTWIGLGTYMASFVTSSPGQTCINYFILLSFFLVYFLTLIIFSILSCVWKLHDLVVNRDNDGSNKPV